MSALPLCHKVMRLLSQNMLGMCSEAGTGLLVLLVLLLAVGAAEGCRLGAGSAQGGHEGAAAGAAPPLALVAHRQPPQRCAADDAE